MANPVKKTVTSDEAPARDPQMTAIPNSQDGEVGRRAAAGMTWLGLQQIIARAIGFIGQLVLALLLAPEHFGLIALAMTITAFFLIVADFGVENILVQRQRAFSVWRSHGFWLSAVSGIVMGSILALLAPVVARLYDTPEVTGLVLTLALAVPATALGIVPLARLRLEMRFGRVAGIMVVETLALQIVSVTLAFLTFGAYSFAIATTVVAILKTSLLWYSCPQKIRFRIDIRRWSFLILSGLSIVGTRLVDTFKGQADLVALGIVATANSAGWYFFAYRLAYQPLRILAASVSSVMVPTLSILKDDFLDQSAKALRVSRLLAFAIMPVCFLQIALAEPFIDLFFGDKWMPSVAIIQILCLGLAFEGVSWVAQALMIARGSYTELFRLSLIFSLGLIGFVVVFAFFFTWGTPEIRVAAALTTFYCLVQPMFSVIVYGRANISFLAIFKLHLFPALISGISVATPYLVVHHALGEQHNLVEIIYISAAAFLLHILLIRLLAPQVYHEVKNRLLNLRRMRRKQL